MEIREASTDDVDAIRSVAEASWEHDYPDILSRETVEEGFDDWYGGDRLTAEITNPKSFVHLAESDEIAGFVHAIIDGDGGVFMRLYVHPDHRERGIGSELFEHAKSKLVEYDVERLRAMVLAENALGNEFYRTLGFENTSQEVTIIGGEEFEENTYELDVE